MILRPIKRFVDLEIGKYIRRLSTMIAPTPPTPPTGIYGVTWDSSDDSYGRTDDLEGFALSTSPGNINLPIQRLMKRCIFSDLGVVQYYLDPNDSTKKWDGSPSDLTGGDGQVMVEIPLIYYKFEKVGTVNSWRISLTSQDGFTRHPAFVKGGGDVDDKYFSAYEGYRTGSKLSSVSGQTPHVSRTRASFRQDARNRGSVWHQQDVWMTHLVQLLYLVEYADFNSQAMISEGQTQYSSSQGTPPSLTGLSNSIGNASGGQSTPGGSANDFMSYRGIENLFGHLWKLVDGFNVHNSIANGSRAWICGDHTLYADNTEGNYTLVGTLGENEGYLSDLAVTALGLFFPDVVLGSSTTYLCDWYWTNYQSLPDVGWLICMASAAAHAGLKTGAFNWYIVNDSTGNNAWTGARLCY